PLLLVAERALQLVLVDDAELGEKLSKALARRHPVSVPYRFTRARYSSREKTPFSMSSSTMALSAATDRRCVSSTPRSTSTALPPACGLRLSARSAPGRTPRPRRGGSATKRRDRLRR